MRPVNIVVLVLAGAVAGAALMRVVQRPMPGFRHAAVGHIQPPAPTVVPEPVPPPTVASPQAAVNAAQPATNVRSEPVKPQREIVAHRRAAVIPARQMAAKPAPAVAHKPSPVGEAVPPAGPVLVAENQPPAPVTPPQTPPEPLKEAPPARSEPENVTPAPAPLPPEPPKVTLNTGMLIPVRLVDGLSSERNHAGDAFAATLNRELVAGDFVIAERGARVEGRVVASGRDSLELELTHIHLSDNQDVAVETEYFEKHAPPDHRQDAEKIGAGAVLGAVVGGIAGGGKGAAIGAGLGGGVGAGVMILTHPPAKLTAETRITFRLRAPVTITEKQ